MADSFFCKVTGSASNSWSAENTALTILNFGQRTQFIQTTNIMIQTLRFLIGYLNLQIAFTMYLPCIYIIIYHIKCFESFFVFKSMSQTQGLTNVTQVCRKVLESLTCPCAFYARNYSNGIMRKWKGHPHMVVRTSFRNHGYCAAYLDHIASISVDVWHVFKPMIPWSQTRISSQIVLQSHSNAEKKQIWGLSPVY